MKKLLIVLTVALSLNGCAGTPLGDALHAATATYANPLGPVDIYRVKNTYAIALELVAQYREYCWSRPYAVLMTDPVSKPVCQNRRAIVRLAQRTQIKARAAIGAAETFILENPRLSAATVISAAWKAVTDFQKSVPAPTK